MVLALVGNHFAYRITWLMLVLRKLFYYIHIWIWMNWLQIGWITYTTHSWCLLSQLWVAQVQLIDCSFQLTYFNALFLEFNLEFLP